MLFWKRKRISSLSEQNEEKSGRKKKKASDELFAGSNVLEVYGYGR